MGTDHPTPYIQVELNDKVLSIVINRPEKRNAITAAMYAAMVAPNANVEITGTFDYFGGLLAKELLLNGSGMIHYDESLGGGGKVSDVQFKLRTLAQHYR